ncbi:MAG TPA: DUF2442 domain-containing protein [Pirellulaceae bacterium]|jgi:hypothetical protein
MDAYPIASVTAFEHVGPYMLRVSFDDGGSQTIDFAPVLYGNIYGPLRDPAVFNQVRIDPDFPTLVWPNKADFDPATLRYWPEYLPRLLEVVERWKHAPSAARS